MDTTDLEAICAKLDIDPMGPDINDVKNRSIVVHQTITTWTIEYDTDTGKLMTARCSIRDGIV